MPYAGPRGAAIESRAMGRLLHGWKDIASYLERDIRTAQRWERRLGMPVHRPSRDGKESVWADSKELDEWRISRSAASRASEVTEAAPVPVDAISSEAVDPDPIASDVVSPAVPEPQPTLAPPA